MIKDLLDHISSIGVNLTTDDQTKRKIRLTNQLVLLACAMSFVQALVMIAAPAYSLMCFASVLLCGLTLVLNGTGLHDLSRLYFSFISCFVIIVASASLSNGENFAYRILLIQAFVIPMVVFDLKETKMQLISFLFFVLAFTLYSPIGKMIPLFEGINPLAFDGNMVVVTIGILCLVTMLLGSRYLQKTHRKKENKILERLQNSKEEIAVLEERNVEVQNNIKYADQIQKGLLPKDKLIRRTLPDHFAYCLDAEDSSGDFYWYGERDGKIIIATLETSGFRTAEVMISIIFNMTLEKIVGEKRIVEPKAIVENLCLDMAYVLKDQWNEVHEGTDISVCSIDVEEEVLRYAGSTDGIILRRGQEFVRPIVTTKNRKASNGLTYNFFQHEVKLTKMNRLYIFTSGVGKLLAHHNVLRNENLDLLATLISNKDYSLDIQSDCISQMVKRSISSSTQDEDVLILGFQFNTDTLKQIKAGQSFSMAPAELV